ncbi:MAG: hypothetical protein AAF614_00125 [Chloroflexota bacterium]
MGFLANLNSFFLANEVAIVTVVAASLVLFQLVLLASTILSETAVSTDSVQAVPVADGNVDENEDMETAVSENVFEAWAKYPYMPYMF